jgi:hypothetical protein
VIEAKTFRTFIGIYPLFKNERLSANILLTVHKALIRPVMTYACPAREFAAETHILKLQRYENKILRTIVNFPKSTPLRDLHTDFNFACVHEYKKWFRRQAEAIQNHENEYVRGIRQSEARHRKYKSLKLGGGQDYDRSMH